MDKKIAVLGSVKSFKRFLDSVENKEVFHFVKDEFNLFGKRFSNYILLYEWEKNYQDYNRVLSIVKNRVIL